MIKISSAIFKTFFLSLCIVANTHFAFGQTASILPPGYTQYLDSNGKPLSAGKVYNYVPNTTTLKTTWQDAAETIPNANPVILDAGGRAKILGDGSYRQIVKDRNNVTIWDAVTSSTGSGSSAPTATGDGDLVGTIKPWAGMTAPNQYAFTYGQEVSRTTYATLYTAITSSQSVFCNSGSPTLNGLSDTTNFWIGMSVEASCVAAGFSTIISKTSSTVTLAANANVTTNVTAIFYPWGRGNGTTTFNLPDLRGVVPAGNNNMGGVASLNLTTTYFGATNPNSIGALGGTQSKALIAVEIPGHNHPVFLNDPGHSHTTDAKTLPGGAVIQTGAGIASGSAVVNANTTGITIRDATGTASTANQTSPTGGGVAVSATIGVAGSGYTPGSQIITVAGGTCTTQPQFTITVSGGGVFSGTPALLTAGSCTVAPTNPAATTGGGGTGGTLNITYSAQPFSLIPPTRTTNYIIKITPDANSATASGVTSLGGMTGSIACGSGLTCTGNTISSSLTAGLDGYTVVSTGVAGISKPGIKTVSPEQFGSVSCDGSSDATSLIQDAVDSTGSDGVVVSFSPNCTYKVTSTINIAKAGVYFAGNSKLSSVVLFAPTANDVLFNWGNGASSIYEGGISNLLIYSNNGTYTKTAILVRDQREFTLDNVRIAGSIVAGGTDMWSGSNSIGLSYQGRDGLRTYNLVIAADRPIVLQENPNSIISIDIAQFNKTQLVANANPCIEAEAGVTATRVSFYDLWCGLGTHGFYSNGSTTALAWQDILFQNFGLEQGTDANAYNVYMASTSHQYQGITINNVLTDNARKGFYFRNSNGVVLSNIIHGAANEFLNLDSSNANITTYGIDASLASQSITGLVANNVTTSSAYTIPRTATYTNTTTDKTGVNVLTPLTTLHIGSSGVASGSEATYHGNIQVDSDSTNNGTNGIEWKSATAGSGYGWRAATITDGASNIDWVLQSRQNSASWTNWLNIKGSNGSVNALSGILSSGVAGTTLGRLDLSGNTSGTVSIRPQAAAGTYNFNLPTAAGSSGECLKSGGGGAAAQTYGPCSDGTVDTVATTTNATYYPLFVASSVNSNQTVNLSTGFSINPNTNTLGLSAINASGTISGATAQFTTGNFTTNNSSTYNASDTYTFTAGVTAYKSTAFASISQTASTGSAPFNAAGALILQSRGTADRDVYVVTGSSPTIRVTVAGASGDTTFASTTASTSTATGSGIFGGGIGVAGAGWFGTYGSFPKIRTTSAPPTPTSCGTTPAVVGSDLAGEVTMGTGSPTGCVLTFANAYTSAPFCTITWQTNLASMQYTISSTAITLVQTATSSNKVNYNCVARSGG